MSEFLSQNDLNNLVDGHPIKVYLQENDLIRDLINQIQNLNIIENFDTLNVVKGTELHYSLIEYGAE